MSDTPLEDMFIEGCRPPYKKAAWILGQVGSEELLRRAQTAPEGLSRNKTNLTGKRRPKSTPANKFNDETRTPRRSCFRFSQVNSARRRKSLENIMQAPQERGEMSVVDLAPGYVLSRSKERISVTIKTDDFFNENEQSRSRRKKLLVRHCGDGRNGQCLLFPLAGSDQEVPTQGRIKPPDEKDLVIAELQKQIDDLTLLLEEDRLNHRTSMRKSAEDHQTHLTQIHNQHREHICSLEEDHRDENDKLKDFYNKKLEEERARAETENARIQCELDSLHGAFEAYKETVAVEMDYKWERREKQLYQDSELRLEEELSKQRKELIREKSSEIDGIHKEHQRQIQVIAEDHRKEVDRLMEKFAQSIADAGQLKKTLLEMQELLRENEEMKEKIKKTSDKLRKTQAELEDKKVKLQGFEENFAEKVAEVDDKYSMRMHSLMSNNTDLRRHYIKKCEQVFKLRTENDVEQEGSLRSAKETMQAVILARSRTNVSLTALRNEDLSSNVHSSAVSQPRPYYVVQDFPEKPRGRPRSAPSTPKERHTAVAETSAIEVPETKALVCGLGLAELQSTKARPHTSHHSRHSSPRSSLLGIRETLQPTPVSVSDQALQLLRDNRVDSR